MQVDVTTEAHEDVIEGLSRTPRQLPAKYFYDEKGSRLFDEICRTSEYYVTRTEVALLEKIAPELSALLGPHVRIVELGSGSSTKTRILLDALESPAVYLPVDISADYLAHVANRLAQDYPDLDVQAVVADFTQPFELPARDTDGRTVVFFPGSSIGNFGPVEIPRLLNHIRSHLGQDGRFLIGIDLVKDPRILDAAYNDASGVTARFNLNMLDHLNAVADDAFQTTDFEHRAFYDEELRRIEMHLVAHRATQVAVGDCVFDFEPGQSIRTEVSYKFTVPDFAAVARESGLRLVKSWSDERNWFSILMLEVCSEDYNMREGPC